jgi:hypothetical protein
VSPAVEGLDTGPTLDKELALDEELALDPHAATSTAAATAPAASSPGRPWRSRLSLMYREITNLVIFDLLSWLVVWLSLIPTVVPSGANSR